MIENSRRIFLQRAAAVAAAAACRGPFASAEQTFVPKPARGWMTAGQQRFKEIPVQPWQSVMGGTAPAIEIDASKRFQSILGFGAAMTDASCYLLSKMQPDQRQQLMEEFFGASGLRLSVSRTCIGSSDYSCTPYSFDDSPTADPGLKNFSIAHDCEYIVPVLREAAKINPSLFFLATPWSPPGWMKTGGSLLGGSMRKEYFQSYAQYFIKFLEAYKAQGIQIGAVTCQNEVDTDQDGRMPACLWGQEYEAAFIRDFLGPALRNASLDTKIWLLDHNYDLWGRVMDELSDPGVFAMVDGIAWHGYVGTPDAMTRVRDAFPAKSAYWTEGGPDITAPDYAMDWAKWSSSFASILKNWARCVIGWNFVLDENGQPNIGPFHCGGVVTLNSKSHELERSGQYWAFAHYSKAVLRGAHVIASKSDVSGLEHVAFANLDGTYVAVLTNEGEDRQVNCGFKGKAVSLDLPHDSVVTLQWS